MSLMAGALVFALAVSSAPAADPMPPQTSFEVHELASKRPLSLPILYGSLGAFQGLDVYSTRRALGAGARELNPVIRGTGYGSGTMLAVKAISTATAIYLTERAWKKNRKGAIALMAIVNGVTAAVAVRNLRNAR